MGRQSVVSREYKAMLRVSHFAGDEKKLLKEADAVWRDFSRTAAAIVLKTDGRLSEIKTRRLITFFDTPGRHLRTAGYIFRQRRDIESGEREVTLKFRHADRYVAQSRSMKPAGRQDAHTKFEEDIKPPYVSLYSLSTTLTIDNERAFTTLGGIGRLFPDISERVDGFRADRAITAVHRFTAREVVIVGGRLQIGKTPRADAECALIVWYDHDARHEKPVAVELSFRYGNKDGSYSGGMCRRAFEVFRALQTKLGRWVDPKPRTKTDLVYG